MTPIQLLPHTNEQKFTAHKQTWSPKVSHVLTPGGVLPYMGYIGMCRCEGYGFQAVYSRTGYIIQSVWV